MANNLKPEQYGIMGEKALKEAVKAALKRHQQLGIPSVFMQNGKIVYLLPDGRIVSKIRNNKKK